jgi:fumarate hydratase class II
MLVALARGAATRCCAGRRRFQRTIRDLARERTSLSEADLDRILDPEAMVEPGRSFASAGG